MRLSQSLVAATFLAAAFAGTGTMPASAQPVTDYRLDNGMQVVVIEDHRAPVVVQMVWYRAGAADEPWGKSGIAHFFEHLMFKATDDMAAGEFSEVVAANGGSDNAFTSQDYTAYYQRIAADRLELMMRMEADRMRDLLLTEEDIATERDVVLEERALRTDTNPNALAREQMRATLFMNHPYRVPVIGWRHEVEALGRADALAFYRRFYAPDNAVLVVAGDVQPEEVLALAQKYYGVLEPTGDLSARVRPAEPEHLAERRMIYSDPRVSQPYLRRSYLAPERNAGDQKEAAALVYLAELLGGSGATSALGRALQFDRQLAVYTAAGYAAVSYDPDSFSLVVVPVPGVGLQEAEDAMDQVIADFLADGVDPAQFDRIKMQIRAQEIYALDDVQDTAQRYGEALTSGLTIADVETWPDVLQAVTPEDVLAAARALFDKRRSVTAWVTNEENKEPAQ
ncbi:MAG TPA: insulinase family protein [Aliiroseovarius sp.]|nr:insulinase family protein [Aliiroseovarius sp.]